MAEEVAIDLNIKTGEAEKNTQSLKAKLKSLKQELAGLDEGSEAFNKIAAEAGKVQDKIGDLNKRVNNLASDTRKLDVVVGVAQGIAGGFAAAQGAAALFGAESEDLNKALLKVQGSVALLNGVQQIAATLNKDSAVMTTLNSAAQSAYTLVVGTSTGALKAFRIALAATGIGLIIIAIGVLIAKWDDLKKAIGFGTDEIKSNTAETYKNIAALKEQQKANEEISKEHIKSIIASLQNLKKLREEAGLDTIEVDKQIRETRLRSGVSETDLEIEEQNRRTDLTISAMKSRAEKEEAARKENEVVKLQGAKDEESRLADLKAQMEAGVLETAELEEEKRLALVQAGVDEEARIKAEANAAQLEADEILAANEIKNAEEVAASKKKLISDTFAIATAGANSLSALNTLITQSENQRRNLTAKERFALEKKQFERGKALAMVNTVINTAQAIMAQQTVPGAGIGLSIMTAITGAIQLATIASQKFDGGSATISPVGSGGGGTTPDSGSNNAPTVPNTPSSIPVPQQVYVTETDISGTQQQVQVIEGLSKIG